jgi:parallel beta-helix repeat protein
MWAPIDLIANWRLRTNNLLTHDVEKLTELELIGKTATKTNEAIAGLNALGAVQDADKAELQASIATGDNARVTIADLENNRKLAADGNFTGTWEGLHPTQSEPGLAATVEVLLSEHAYSVNRSGGSIAAALAYCVANGIKQLYIPNGTYVIATNLTLADIDIIGQSEKGVVIQAAANIDKTYMVTLSGDVSISNVTFDGNNVAYNSIAYGVASNIINLKNVTTKNCAATFTGTYPNTCALEVNGQTVSIENVTVTGNAGHGLNIPCSHPNANYVVKNSNFVNNGVGKQGVGFICKDLRANGANFATLIVDGCVAHGNGASGIAPTIANNVTVSNCHSYNNGEHGFCIMDGKNAIIVGNKASGNVVAGLRIQGDLSIVVEDAILGWDDAIVTGNVFDGNAIGISYTYKVRNILVVGNRLTNCSQYTQFFGNWAGHTNLSNIVSRGNILHCTAAVKRPHSPRSGYILDGSIVIDDFDLNGNKIEQWVMFSGTNAFGSTAKLLKGDRTSIITFPTDYTNAAWVKQGALANGIITADGTGHYMYQRLAYAQQKYLSMVMFIDTANSNEGQIAITARLRRGDVSLILDLGYRYISTLTDTLAFVWDLTLDATNLDLTDTAFIDIWIGGTAAATLKPTGIYACYSSELPIVPNKI